MGLYKNERVKVSHSIPSLLLFPKITELTYNCTGLLFCSFNKYNISNGH